jgi:hypothetical protein
MMLYRVRWIRVAILSAALPCMALSCGSSDSDPSGPAKDAGGGGAAGTGGTGGATGGSSGSAGSAGVGGAGAAGAGGVELPTCAQTTSQDVVFAPTESPFGVSHAEWGQRWFQWAMSLPRTDHPSLDGPCDQGQSEPAWFLATPRLGSGTRTCTIPEDTGLLVTMAGLLINESADLPEDDCAWGQCPASEEVYKEMCETGLPELIEDVCLEVDGVAVDLDEYLFETGVFRTPIHPDDPFYPLESVGPYGANTCPGDCEEGTDRHFFRCGYWAMLKPLAAGDHTVRLFSVSPPDPEDPTVQDFREVTYELTVE